MYRLIATALLVFATTYLMAQSEFLRQRLEKGKAVLKEKASGKADAERDRLDSVDFNFAISVIDYSGMLNIRDTDERVTKAAYSASNVLLKDGSKTAAEQCRDLLETGQKLYEYRKYKAAETYLVAARLAYENEGLTDNINYSKVFSDLGLLHASMGRYSTAAQFTEEAKDMRERTLGEKSFGFVASLNNRAVLYQELAQFNEAEKDFERAKQLAAEVYGTTTQEYAIILNNEAMLWSEVGRYDDAIGNLQTAIAQLDNARKKSVRNQVAFQSNLAVLYQRTNRLAEAEAIYLKLEKVLGGSNPYYAGVLNNLALLYVQMNKPEKVEAYLSRSAAVYKARFGEENPYYAKVLGDQGWYYRTRGRLAEAEPLLQRAHNIRASVLGTNHPDFIRSKEELAILHWKNNQPQKAYDHYREVMEKTLEFIGSYFPPMSEAEKTKYWDVTLPRFQRFYNFALQVQNTLPGVVSDVLNYQIATKALLLNATNKVKLAILRSGDVALTKDYLAWLDQKESLARFYALSKDELNQQRLNLDSLERAANAMEKSLSQRSKEFSSGYGAQKISWTDIQSQLADAEALVEIVRVSTYDQDFTPDSRYAAIVVTKTSPPAIAVLENGNTLETRYAKFYKNAILQKSDDAYSYEQYWARFDKLLAGKRVVYFSPDGVYNQINVNTLKKPGGDYVLNQYDITIVGNAKDVLTIKQQKAAAAKKESVLLGFPDYGGKAVALPGTKAELDAISKVLKAAGYAVTQQEQQNASEKSLKAVKAPTVLHVATHGYFLADADLQTGEALGVTAENARNNPLLRSGLILANPPDSNSEALPNLNSNDNGILTAYEAMNLNLTGTDLVVLSACETGLGDVRAGEGVYGLQRAFVVAGANALVMSLWKVDDSATQQLMTSFYTYWTQSGNKLQAFKRAQQQLMLKYKDPYYWGAFVMMGK